MKKTGQESPRDTEREVGRDGRSAAELELQRAMDLDPRFQRLQRGAIIAGALGLLAALAGLLLGQVPRFFQAYLVAFLFWSGISLGALAITMLHYLVGGGWGIVIRRVGEAASKTLWLTAVLFVPLVFGLAYLYPWARPELVAADPVLQHKSLYLNVPFFIIRAIVYFAVWIGLSQVLTRWAEEPEHFYNLERRRNLQRLSAIGIIVLVLTVTFASIDWVMSLEPAWFSSIFGFLIITGQVLAGLAFVLMILPLLVHRQPLSSFVTPGLFRDLGALLLTMVILWAYMSFSQYLIIWYGNIPREVTWYLNRSTGGWVWLIVLVFVIQFVVPFLVLLSLQAKRNLRLLAGLSIAILIIRFVEYHWLVIPSFHPEGLSLHWLDFALPLALGGAWIPAFIWHLRRTPPTLFTRSGIQEAGDRGPEQTPA